MQLNESTYETIFLLYIDNELSPKERLEVEAFIVDNPNYALEMEALKATVLSAENVPYAFKENLKQQLDSTSLEDLEKDWDTNYAMLLKEVMQAIPGLSTYFKNTLKKETVSQGKIITPFGFNQHKFTYAAIAACLMVFIGYQQLTKIETLPSAASPFVKTEISNASPKTNQPVKTIQEAISKSQANNAGKIQRKNLIQQASIAMAEPTSNNGSLSQTVMKEMPRTYNNPITIDAIPLTISSANLDAAPTEVEKELTSYEIIDTEDPNRTIFIANFEIDGNKFRGLTRRVSALLKRNKSEKEK
jgi:hypothetical protein